MQSKNQKPTKKQIEWREAVREMGCVNHPGKRAEIHHVVGVTGRQDKIKIGHWFILPLCTECHRTDPEYNVTTWRKRFTEHWGDQRALFAEVVDWYLQTHRELPFGSDVYNAISNTRK